MHYIIFNNYDQPQGKCVTNFPYINPNNVACSVGYSRVLNTENYLKENTNCINVRVIAYLITNLMYNPYWEYSKLSSEYNIPLYDNISYIVSKSKIYTDEMLFIYKKFVIQFLEIENIFTTLNIHRHRDNLEFNCFLNKTVIRINSHTIETSQKPCFIEKFEQGESIL